MTITFVNVKLEVYEHYKNFNHLYKPNMHDIKKIFNSNLI
jgi:hypothetical protein